MGFKSYVDTVERKDTIEWITLKELDVKENFIKKVNKSGIKDAEKLKHCDNLDKYNLQITPDEEEFLKKIKDDVSSKQESISRTFIKDAKKVLSSITNKLSESDSFNIKKLTEKYINELNKRKNSFKEDIGGKLKKYISIRRELVSFQMLNNLERSAEYPQSILLFLGIIFSVLMIESIANSFFYAQGSDLGFLGGIFMAFAISIANVAISFSIGFVTLRYLNHVNKVKKTIALLGLLILLVVLFFLHLASAHYRELALVSPDNATSQVLKETFNNPFNINDFESFILIIIGFAISASIVWKAYRFDDPYPGYGKVWRKWENSNDEKKESIKKYIESLSKIRDEFNQKSIDLNKNIHNAVNNTNDIIEDITTYKATIDRYYQNTKDNAMHIVRTYRQAYNKAAEKEKLLIDEDIAYNVEEYLGLSKLQKLYQEIINFAKETKDKIDKEAMNLKNNRDDFIKKVDYLYNDLTNEDAIESMIDQAYEKAKKEIKEDKTIENIRQNSEENNK